MIEIIRRLSAEKIQTRPIWALIQDQADYPQNQYYGTQLARHYLSHQMVIIGKYVPESMAFCGHQQSGGSAMSSEKVAIAFL